MCPSRPCSLRTIASNIRMGKEEATLDEVRKAAETAQALEFITAMPDGFDSEVAQGGVISPAARSSGWLLPGPWCGAGDIS